ncbi:MAG: hypothetical protein Q7U74_08815 [Saprospiraceae bacterium]|nr:hypothetical protein [Saprospiraceae bacterium]
MKIQLNIFRMILAIVGFGLAVVYLTILVSSRDPLWFLGGFNELPDRIIVYSDGQKKEYNGQEENFTVLAYAVRASLNSGVYRPSGIGLSPDSLKEAYEKYITVEVFFPKVVRLYTTYNKGEATQMLFLITGRHSQVPTVLQGRDGIYLVNPPVLKTKQPLLDALKQLGYKID